MYNVIDFVFISDVSLDMGPYRDPPPPSVSSMVSDSTYVSEYSSVLSPRNDLEVLDESGLSVPAPQQAHTGAWMAGAPGRRNNKRKASGAGGKGKDLKRLGVTASRAAKAAAAVSSKPYPDATARNGRLSRLQQTEYQESNSKSPYNTAVFWQLNDSGGVKHCLGDQFTSG